MLSPLVGPLFKPINVKYNSAINIAKTAISATKIRLRGFLIESHRNVEAVKVLLSEVSRSNSCEIL